MSTVRTNDVETYYEDRGEGPVVVFVHGMFMNAGQWEPQMEALVGEYRTIAYDVRGHGRTGGSDRESYSIDLFASDLDELLAALDVEDAVVVGLSMGGAVAQVYAATYSERVAGIVLSDTFTAAPLPLTGRLAMANIRFLARLDRVVGYRTLNRVQLWVGNRLLPGVAGDEVTIQRAVESGPPIPHDELVKIADSTAAFTRSDFDLSVVDVPTLVLYGEHAPPAMREMQGLLAEQLGDAAVALTAIPDAGHASNLDNPEFFTGAVREFLTAVNRPTGESDGVSSV